MRTNAGWVACPTGKPRLPPRDPGRRWPPCRDPRKGGRLCAGQPWGCVPSRHPYTQLLGASALRPFPRELDTPRLRPLAAPGARNSGDQRATGQQHRRQEPPTAAESELEKSLHGERGRLRASVSTGGLQPGSRGQKAGEAGGCSGRRSGCQVTPHVAGPRPAGAGSLSGHHGTGWKSGASCRQHRGRRPETPATRPSGRGAHRRGDPAREDPGPVTGAVRPSSVLSLRAGAQVRLPPESGRAVPLLPSRALPAGRRRCQGLSPEALASESGFQL